MIISIRQQGGAAVMTIPAEVLKKFDWKVGSKVDLTVLDDGFSVHASTKPRKRYALSELLLGSEQAQELADQTHWAREGNAVGMEIA